MADRLSRRKGFRQRLLDLLFPPKCVFCRTLLREGERGVCRSCPDRLPWTAKPVSHGPFFDACVSPLRYEGEARESRLRYKFRGRYSYAEAYGPVIAAAVRDRLEGSFDLVTWVPVSAKRKKERGYDQAQLLAAAVAEELELPLFATLEKTVHTPPQSGLTDPAQRRGNVLGVYRAVESLAGCRVLLIDDVVTTGATLSECARVLREAGAAAVSCATLLSAGK